MMSIKNLRLMGDGIMVGLKSMSRKEKIQYIWDYYKLHIISVIIVIAVIASFIHGQLTKIDYVVNVTIIGNAINESKKEEVEKKFTSLVVKEGERRKQALIDVIATDKSELSYEMMQKFVVRIAAGEIDVVILDKGFFDSFVKQDMFIPLESISKINLSDIKQNKIEASGSTNKAVYAISVEGNKELEAIGYNTKNKVLGIIASSKNKDNGIKVFKDILDN
jgi:hypothetical protein